MASDYQGETIQVFVFFRGKFLGYQCFGQDRLTVGGTPGMDLPLPDCPEEEGFWDVYVSRGALYAWLRSPAGGNGKEGHEDPRKVQPLDSLSLGEYRLQAKLLEGQGFELPPIETEEDLTEPEQEMTEPEEESTEPAEENLLSPDERIAQEEPDKVEEGDEQEEQELSSSEEPGEEEGLEPEAAWEAVDEVEGISLDYARSIWKGETENEGAEAAEVESGAVEAEAPPTKPVEDPAPAETIVAAAGPEESQPGPALEAEESLAAEEGTALSDEPAGPHPEYAKSFWGLSVESDPVREEVEDPDDELPGMEEIDEWVGFGMEEEGSLEEEEGPIDEEPRLSGSEAPETPVAVDEKEENEPLVTLAEEAAPQEMIGMESAEDAGEPAEPPVEEAVPAREEASLEDEAIVPEGLQEKVSLETDTVEEASEEPLSAADPGGLVEGMSQEERTSFWDQMAQDAFANERKEEAKPDEAPPEASPFEASPLEASPLEATADPPPAEEEVIFEEEPTRTGEPAFASERLEGANTAVAMDEAQADEDAEAEEAWDFEDEEYEGQHDVTYFSLIKEVFPNRAQPSKAPRGDHRALEVVRFRGSDVQDIGYLERGDAYTIRKGWSRSLWKRQGGVPPNFNLVRFKNGGLAELHLRDNSVKGRLYSEEGSRDIWDLRGGKRGRFGLKGKASWLPLPADTWAVLRVNSGRYLVRYVPPRPKPMAQPLRPNVSAGQFKLVSMSLLSHLLLIMVIGLAVPDSTLEGYNRTDQFARIDPDALKALKPPPPPKELKKPKPVAKKKAPKPKPRPKVASKHRIPKSTKRSPVPTKGKASGGGKKQVDVAQTGLLAALGSPDAGVLNAKGNSEILLAAVTNLDAVAVPSDTTTFNLAGVAGKLATSEIQVPTSDIIETVGAAQLIKNGDGTLGAMASKGSGEVRAIVHEPPKAKISIRGGMSREAVLKVVNAHLDEVRDCYERELLHNPGISGKILMEWLIQLDGAVRYAKVKFTNIGHSSDLHTCLQAQVVTWNFPRPKGGEEVLVTFPFLFESMGF